MANVWKIAPGRNAKYWELCRERSCISINWLNDSNLLDMSKEDILETLEEAEEGGSRSANSIWQFVNGIEDSDIIVANNGLSRVVGIGVVRSPYLPPDDQENPNRDEDLNRQVRLVDWVIDQPIDLGVNIFAINTLTPLGREQIQRIKAAYREQHPQLDDQVNKLFLDSLVDATDDLEDPMPDAGSTVSAKELAMRGLFLSDRQFDQMFESLIAKKTSCCRVHRASGKRLSQNGSLGR